MDLSHNNTTKEKLDSDRARTTGVGPILQCQMRVLLLLLFLYNYDELAREQVGQNA
jgi:hypothetical protein